MREAREVLLSVKEVGFFASRILVAGHCPSGAVPELSRIITARELLSGSGLAAAARHVENDPWVFSDVAAREVGGSAFAPRRAGAPTFVWAPWVLDRLRTRGTGPETAELAGVEADWVPALLATRGGDVVWVMRGSDDEAPHLAYRGMVARRREDTPRWEDERPLSAGMVQLLAPPFGRDDGLDADSPDWSDGVKLSSLRDAAYESGVPISDDTWRAIRRTSEQTLVTTSERSRRGAG